MRKRKGWKCRQTAHWTKNWKPYVSIQKAYAEAIGAYKGAWVPQICTSGGAGSAAGSGAQQMIDLLSVKAAKDLGINMSIEGAAQTTGKQ